MKFWCLVLSFFVCFVEFFVAYFIGVWCFATFMTAQYVIILKYQKINKELWRNWLNYLTFNIWFDKQIQEETGIRLRNLETKYFGDYIISIDGGEPQRFFLEPHGEPLYRFQLYLDYLDNLAAVDARLHPKSFGQQQFFWILTPSISYFYSLMSVNKEVSGLSCGDLPSISPSKTVAKIIFSLLMCP